MRALAVTLGLAAACGTGGRTVDGVDPGVVSSLVATPVQVRGSGLYAPVTSDLDDGEGPAIRRDWRVRIGAVEVDGEAVSWRDPGRIDVVVPAGLPVGAHDVVVIDADGREAVGRGALEVVADPIGLALSIEDAPGGAGAPVGDRTLGAGVDLTLHAVVRDGGAFVADVDVTWEVSGGIGTLSAAGPTSTTTLAARALGTGRVSAAHPVAAGDDTGALSVVAGAPVMVAVEDAPGGAGAAVGDRTLSADDTLALHAVSRDALGNFVADEVVVWSVTGGIGALSAASAASSVFDAAVAGQGTVDIDHPTLAAVGTGTVTVVPGAAASLTVSPDTGATVVGGPAIAFSAAAVDGDGNPTTDVGTVSWSVASGPIAGVDPATGVFTPTMAGSGTVRATSSYGPSDDSGAIDVVTATLQVMAVVAPSSVARGEGNALVEVHVANGSAATASISSVWLTFDQGGDVGDDYEVDADPANPLTIAAGDTEVYRLWVTVDPAPSFGVVAVTGRVEGYDPARSQLVDDTGTATWTVVDAAPPVAVIDAPVPDGNRVCTGGTVDFGGGGSTGSGLGYAWTLAGGSPGTSTSANPTGVTYATPGTYDYALTVTDDAGREDAVRASDWIFVGEAPATAADGYVTGTMVLEDPDPGESVAMDRLPRNEFLDMARDTLATCQGTDVDEDESPYCYVTVFSDRGVLDTSRDLWPAIPGIQVEMHNCNHFDNVALDNEVVQREGAALVYAEFRKEPEGIVTAAGHQTFYMVDDTQAPWITATVPAPCASACAGKDDELWVQFSEPMSPVPTVAAVTVSYRTSSNCSGGGSGGDITAASAISYHADRRALRIVPEVQPQSSYSVLVDIGSAATDASSNTNGFAGATVCWVVDDRSASPAPALPIVGPPVAVSPDGDGTGDTTLFEVGVDAATAAVRIDITRGPSAVRTLLAAAPGPGTYGVPWDGRDDSGRVVPDGFYAYRIYARGPGGLESAAVGGVVEVDSAISYVGVPPR